MGTSSPYFIINTTTTNLVAQAFALNRSNKPPIFNTELRKKSLYEHFCISEEYGNALICLLVLSLTAQPLKTCPLIQGLMPAPPLPHTQELQKINSTLFEGRFILPDYQQDYLFQTSSLSLPQDPVLRG